MGFLVRILRLVRDADTLAQDGTVPSHPQEPEQDHEDRRGREDPPDLGADRVCPPHRSGEWNPADEQHQPQRQVDDRERAHCLIALTRDDARVLDAKQKKRRRCGGASVVISTQPTTGLPTAAAGTSCSSYSLV